MPEAGTKRIHTLIRVGKSEQLIDVASAAIHHVSVKRQQLVSVRPAAVAGFEQILEDDRITVVILMKIYERLDFSGEGFLNIAFSTEEMKLLRECRAVLQTLSLKPLDNPKTIRMALLRHARHELTKATP